LLKEAVAVQNLVSPQMLDIHITLLISPVILPLFCQTKIRMGSKAVKPSLCMMKGQIKVSGCWVLTTQFKVGSRF